MKKIIVYNPYNVFSLYKLFLFYSILKVTFGKAELIKKILPENLYYYLRTKIIKKNVAKYEKTDITLFKNVEIETINRCNNTCGFCPVNKEQDIRTFKRMEEGLFNRIIDQLSDINYSGEIAFHSNNEPLLDNDLANKIAYTHKKCPDAFLYFYTNGILLNAEMVLKFKKSGIQKIVVNNYNNKKKLHKNIENLINELNKLQDVDYPQIVIIIRELNEILNNRGGNSPNKPNSHFNHYKYFQDVPCSLPFEKLVIRPDGKVSLCSQDAYGEITLGDTNKSSLVEIWHGKPFEKIRKTLINNGRKRLPLCEICDY